MASSSSSSSGIGFFGLLGVAFIVLKLTNVITWSWFWVLAPLWGGLVIILLVLAIVFIVAMVMANKKSNRFQNKMKNFKNKR